MSLFFVVSDKISTFALSYRGGGSNSSSSSVFKQDLMKLARKLLLNSLVVHYPPYCSKYNPIEHRMFAHVTRAWGGVPLLSVKQACEQAAMTKTSKGLKVYATINGKSYETNRAIDKSLESDKAEQIIFDDKLPKWNYLIKAP